MIKNSKYKWGSYFVLIPKAIETASIMGRQTHDGYQEFSLIV